MESMVSKAFMKVIGFFASLLLTLFAGMFGAVSLAALVMSVINKDLFSVVGCVVAGSLAWMCWSIRRDPLS